MSQALFFHPDLSNISLILPEEESKHLIRVMRKQKGDTILLIDGKGLLATARIEVDHPKKCELLIIEKTLKEKSKNYRFELAIAPTKNMDRIEWMLEKCCEIGLDTIHFIECENSERSKVNLERLEKICISAIKQSKQYYLPNIEPLVDIKTFLIKTKEIEATKLIAWCETEQNQSLKIAIEKCTSKQFILLIGPEGDFTKIEVDLAVKSGYKDVSLGNTILRTETAGVFACALISGNF
jgi:16S rRNA (uracil1498-N3)-methyltransferase